MEKTEPVRVSNGPNHPSVGKVVIYVDEYGQEHNALVTACWGSAEDSLGQHAINLLYVSGDESKTDPYGRQVERASSVSPEGPPTAHGRFYRVP